MARLDKMLKELPDDKLVDSIVFLVTELIIRHKTEILYQRIGELRLECEGAEILKNLLGET